MLLVGSAKTAIQGNILSDADFIDVSSFGSFAIQIISTGTSGTFIFEGSNNGINFVAVPVYNQGLVVKIPIIAAITATASSFIYEGSCNFKYLRVRIVTTVGGGTITAYSNLLRHALGTTSQIVSNGTAANLLATVSGTVTATVSGTVTANVAPSTTIGYASHNNYISTASLNPTLVKASAGTIGSIMLNNSSAVTLYLKLYNKATVPVVGTDAPLVIIPVPPGFTSLNIPTQGWRFSIGIGFGITGGYPNADTTNTEANEITVSISYV